MTDATHNLLIRRHTRPVTGQTISFGAFLITALIVFALLILAIKLTSGDTTDRPSLIPFDQPAALSGFTA